jgi:hypothetical protein
MIGQTKFVPGKAIKLKQAGIIGKINIIVFVLINSPVLGAAFLICGSPISLTCPVTLFSSASKTDKKQ